MNLVATLVSNEITGEAVTLGVSATLIKLLVGFGLGLLISASYVISDRKNYSKNYAIMLVILPALVGFVILMIGSNIARAFSIAGIFSLVRFRSIPGDSKDIITIFFAMAVGLAVGMGFYTEAAIITIVVGLVIAGLANLPAKKSGKNERQLRVTLPENLNFENVFDDLFEKYTDKASLSQIKTTNMGTLFELTYVISMKPQASTKELMDDIRTRNGNLNVTINMVPAPKKDQTTL